MPSRQSRPRVAKALAAFGFAAAASAGPCDIYASGGTPCVAAHSTTRALYNSYNGPLYQVRRDEDGQTTTIDPLSAGGVANAAMQDNFCNGKTCVITVIYDQSGRGNHLTQAPPGGAAQGPEPNGYDSLASAIGAPVTLNGKKAYGVFISPKSGYRNNQPNGTATGDDPEGMYAVLDGTHYNTGCCFDYGNAETNSKDTGNGHMEAIYFGTGDGSGRGTGAGNGPWIMADLENGLFSGHDPVNNQADPTITYRFVTAIIKGKQNHWAIRGGNSASGTLSTYYDGDRPNNAAGYTRMSKEGAIILGTGGDNSDSAQGTFYEGVMTTGYPSDSTEASVQADIVAAKYAVAPLNSGPALNIGSKISIRATTSCCTTRYLAHTNDVVNTQVVTGSSSSDLKASASWTVRTGLGNSGCISFESVSNPGSFIRHRNYELHVDANDNSKLFHEDATFCYLAGRNGQGNSFRSWSIPTHWIRHFNAVGYIASNGGFNMEDAKSSFDDDVSWVVGASFA